jgi:hypothetical protein
LGYLGLPWATLDYHGRATLVVLMRPWATLGSELPWATLGYIGLPEYLYWVSHQHCPST